MPLSFNQRVFTIHTNIEISAGSKHTLSNKQVPVPYQPKLNFLKALFYKHNDSLWFLMFIKSPLLSSQKFYFSKALFYQHNESIPPVNSTLVLAHQLCAWYLFKLDMVKTRFTFSYIKYILLYQSITEK